MRVALLVFKSLPIYGIQLANALVKFTDFHLFIADTAASRYSTFIDPRIKLHRFPTYRYRNPAGLFVSLNLIREIKRNRCNIAHLVFNEPWFNVCIPFIKSFPLITTIHDIRYHVGDRRSNIVPQLVSDLATRFSSGLIVHGLRLKKYLCKEFKINPNLVFVSPMMNFSIYRHWEKPDIKQENNNILFFGSIWKYKGLKYLMKTEPYLSEQLDNFKITIAGKGEDLSKYRKYMTNPKRYEIINEFIPDERVTELFQKASVVVLPYIEASQSAVVPLAFAFGKPVVVTDVGSIPEIVDHGKDGLIVAPRDPEALAQGIITLLKDPVLRRRMSENARIKADTELSLARIGEVHLSAYEQLLKL